jgi:hypothetical protein
MDADGANQRNLTGREAARNASAELPNGGAIAR